MTQLTDKERKAQIADMKSFDEQMPCVGIFWYDPDEHGFFGVRKKEITPKIVEEAAEKGVPFINYPHLHRQIWAKEFFRAQAMEIPLQSDPLRTVSNWPPRPLENDPLGLRLET